MADAEGLPGLVDGLRLLGELREDAHRKDERQQPPGQQAVGSAPAKPRVQQDEHTQGRQIPCRLVELGRVPGNLVDEVEDHAPRPQRGLADDLRIHEVPEPDADRPQSPGQGQPVEKPQQGNRRGKLPPGQPEPADQPGDAAVTRQPSLPDGENLHRVGEIVLRFVKKAVREPRPDDRAEHGVQQQPVEAIFGNPLLAENAPEKGQPGQKRRGEEQAVPPQGEWAEGNDDRIDVPVDQHGCAL
ncbi:hypothetical protein DSECCO2_536510 [anaerobic digester metagenome]